MIDRKMKMKKQLVILVVYSSIHYIPTACHAKRNVLPLQESPRQRPVVRKRFPNYLFLAMRVSQLMEQDGRGECMLRWECICLSCICTSHFRGNGYMKRHSKTVTRTEYSARHGILPSSKDTLQRRSDLCIPKNETASPHCQFPRLCIWERLIHILPQSVHLFCCSKLRQIDSENIKSLTDT
jgi:hypothetical protein